MNTLVQMPRRLLGEFSFAPHRASGAAPLPGSIVNIRFFDSRDCPPPAMLGGPAESRHHANRKVVSRRCEPGGIGHDWLFRPRDPGAAAAAMRGDRSVAGGRFGRPKPDRARRHAANRGRQWRSLALSRAGRRRPVAVAGGRSPAHGLAQGAGRPGRMDLLLPPPPRPR